MASVAQNLDWATSPQIWAGPQQAQACLPRLPLLGGDIDFGLVARVPSLVDPPSLSDTLSAAWPGSPFALDARCASLVLPYVLCSLLSRKLERGI